MSPPAAGSPAPSVRTVVVDYNGGAMTRRCLEALLATEWPDDRHEVVMVDNGSTDGLADEVEADLPRVRVVRAGTNLGFGGGCNLGMGRVEEVDYVGLVNNDAFVEPGWLAPLVEALEADPTVGAASPKILFEPKFLDVEIETPTFVPDGHDHRSLGVRVSGVEVHGRDAWRAAQLVDGFWGLERGEGEEVEFQWTYGRSRLRVPVPPSGPFPTHCRVRMTAEREKEVTVRSGDRTVSLVIGVSPAWYTVPLAGEPYDVVNNAGSNLVRGGFGADRGYLQRDDGQFDEPAEVFAWCGAGVLLRSTYLQQVGRFDEHFFLYYEDTDLAWRARLRGWRHVYVPASSMRHVHSATTVEGSPLFRHFVDRNRLLMLARSAPATMFVAAVWSFLSETVGLWWRDVVKPRLRGDRPHSALVAQRVRSLGGFLKALPGVLADRLTGLRSRRCRPTTVTTWATE